MKKSKKWLALVLASIIAFTPSAQVAASEASAVNEETVVESETVIEEEAVVESLLGSEAIEEITVETEVETETTTVETEVETETTTVETEVNTETTEEETTIETEVETETTEEKATIETEVETETTEEETTAEEEVGVNENIPGMDNYILSSEDKADLNALRKELDNIRNIKEGEECKEGELVFLADTEEEALAVASGYGAQLKSYEYGVAVIELSDEVSVAEALEVAAMQTDDIVLAPAWPNYYNYLFDDEVSTDEYVSMEITEYEVTEIADENSVSAANDPFLSESHAKYQWHHNMVGSEIAWISGYTGKGVKVAILDSGVNAHEDLKMAGNYSTVNSSTTDGNGHGTHVAGIVGAKYNNSKGGAGIAPDATIYNIRVMSADGKGTDADIMEGINKSVSLGVDILNLSLGGYKYNGEFAKVVKNAYESGVTVFVAAGNDSSSTYCYPAEYAGAYSVGAVRQDKGRCYFSNYGRFVEYSAPGEDIYSTYNTGTSSYTYMSGTSQATPVIAGTAAVILSAKPEILSKTGKAKVNALIAVMNKGKIAGNGGAASIVSIPKALGLATTYDKPKAPTFSVKNGTIIEANTTSIVIKKNNSENKVYYSIDGKDVTFKNGTVSENAKVYTGAITIGNAAKVTVKAIEVNPAGVSSSVATATYKFAPLVQGINITGDTRILLGKSTKLTATVSPAYAANKKVTWSVVDKQGKTVSNGTVKVSNGTVKVAKNAEIGTYIITAMAADGSGKKGTFKIEVKGTATVSTIKFKPSKETIDISASGKTLDIKKYIDITLINKLKGTLNDVSWSTSNANVATVSGGVVKALSAGTAKITATATDGSGKKAVFTVIVKQKATSVTISGYDKLALGKSIKLTATVAPATTSNKKLTWSVTPDKQGVTVTNGTVKATSKAKAGTYTITATATDGSEVKASKKIVVTDNVISKISLSDTKITLFRTSGTYKSPTSAKITAIIVSKAGNTNVEFTSSNPGIAKVTQNGTTATITVTGKATGTTKITCKALDGSGKSATCTVSVVNAPSMFNVVPSGGYSTNIANGCKVKFNAVMESANGKLSNTKVKWSSSNPSVATVDANGNVKALKENEVAIITATAMDGSGATSSCMITTWSSYKRMEAMVFDEEYWRLLTPSNYVYPVNIAGSFNIYFDGYLNCNNGKAMCPLLAVEVSNPSVVTAYTDYDRNTGRVYLNFVTNKKGTSSVTIKALDGTNRKVTYKMVVK